QTAIAAIFAFSGLRYWLMRTPRSSDPTSVAVGVALFLGMAGCAAVAWWSRVRCDEEGITRITPFWPTRSLRWCDVRRVSWAQDAVTLTGAGGAITVYAWKTRFAELARLAIGHVPKTAEWSRGARAELEQRSRPR